MIVAVLIHDCLLFLLPLLSRLFQRRYLYNAVGWLFKDKLLRCAFAALCGSRGQVNIAKRNVNIVKQIKLLMVVGYDIHWQPVIKSDALNYFELVIGKTDIVGGREVGGFYGGFIEFEFIVDEKRAVLLATVYVFNVLIDL
jgi:hypothetical protein